MKQSRGRRRRRSRRRGGSRWRNRGRQRKQCCRRLRLRDHDRLWRRKRRSNLLVLWEARVPVGAHGGLHLLHLLLHLLHLLHLLLHLRVHGLRIAASNLRRHVRHETHLVHLHAQLVHLYCLLREQCFILRSCHGRARYSRSCRGTRRLCWCRCCSSCSTVAKQRGHGNRHSSGRSSFQLRCLRSIAE